MIIEEKKIREILYNKPEGFTGYNLYEKEYCNVDHEIISIEMLEKILEVKEMARRYKYYVLESDYIYKKADRLDGAIGLLQSIYTELLIQKPPSNHPLNQYTHDIQDFLQGSDNDKLKNNPDIRNDDTLSIVEKNMLKSLFYAPSSPVSPKKAAEIESWYLKFKKVKKLEQLNHEKQ